MIHWNSRERLSCFLPRHSLLYHYHYISTWRKCRKSVSFLWCPSGSLCFLSLFVPLTWTCEHKHLFSKDSIRLTMIMVIYVVPCLNKINLIMFLSLQSSYKRCLASIQSQWRNSGYWYIWICFYVSSQYLHDLRIYAKH